MLLRALSAGVIAVICGSFIAIVHAENKEVKVHQSWSGILSDESLLKVVPMSGKPIQGVTGCIIDMKTWQKLWSSWRDKQSVPTVDFSKQFVIVITYGGPNKISLVNCSLDDKGNLSVLANSTLIGGKGFCYLLAVIPRDHIRTVEGMPVPKP